jgi:hypothetical protein
MTKRAQNIRYEEFQAHLLENAREVRSWPDWMRCGTRASMGLDSFREQSDLQVEKLPLADESE